LLADIECFSSNSL